MHSQAKIAGELGTSPFGQTLVVGETCASEPSRIMSPGRSLPRFLGCDEVVKPAMQCFLRHGQAWTLDCLWPLDNVGSLWQTAEANAGVPCPPKTMKCGTRDLVDQSYRGMLATVVISMLDASILHSALSALESRQLFAVMGFGVLFAWLGWLLAWTAGSAPRCSIWWRVERRAARACALSQSIHLPNHHMPRGCRISMLFLLSCFFGLAEGCEIACALMVKNEEDSLPRTLRSMQCSSLYALDTGSMQLSLLFIHSFFETVFHHTEFGDWRTDSEPAHAEATVQARLAWAPQSPTVNPTEPPIADQGPTNAGEVCAF